MPARVKTLTSTTEIAIGSVSRSDARTSGRATPRPPGEHQHDGDDRDRPDVSAEHERADRPAGRDDRLGQRIESMDTASASAGRAGRRSSRSAGSRSSARTIRADAGRLRAPPRGRSPSHPAGSARRIGARASGGSRRREELERLVDRVRQQALLEDRLGQVGAGLLERGDQEVRAGAGHAAEDERGDRRRDDRRDDPADQRRRPRRIRRRCPGGRTSSRSARGSPATKPIAITYPRTTKNGDGLDGVTEERERAVRVERQESVVADAAEDRRSRRARRAPTWAQVGFGRLRKNAELADEPGEQPDPRRDDREWRGEVRMERRRQHVGPDEVCEQAGDQPGDRPASTPTRIVPIESR